MEYLVFENFASVWSKDIWQPVVTDVVVNTDFVAENTSISCRIHGDHCITAGNGIVLTVVINCIIDIVQ